MSAGDKLVGSEKFMVCSMCGGQTGKLSPFYAARDTCIICSQWIPHAQTVPAYLCMKHKKQGAPGTEHCGLCSRPLTGVFEKGKTQAKMCNRCGFGLPRCGALII